MGTLRTACISLILALVPASGTFAETALHPSSEHLVDLSANHWCYDCVVKVIDEYDVLSGFDDHTFRGEWQVSRYALAVAVARTYSQLKLERRLDIASVADGRAKTIGVLPEHWAYPYVRKLVEESGLLSMLMEKGNFQGDRVVTRKELAYALSEFLSKLETAMGKPLQTERRESQLAVDLDMRSPFRPSIDQALNRYQVMNLFADHTFRPDAPVTRYDLSASLCKIFALFERPENAPTEAAQQAASQP
ncbi:MAG: S-layer homology domain-containing protein [Candidatus Sericytochromatia bacterium]